MNYKFIKLKKANLHTIEIEKFKTIQIEVKMRYEAVVEDITKRSILPYVLKSATKKYKNKQAISAYLEELYGASLFVATSRHGRVSTINFSLRIVNEKYLKNQSLIKEAIIFLHEVLFNPLLVKNAFKTSIVNEEKRLLIDEIKSIKDDKMRYALKMFNEEMYSSEFQRFSTLGTKEEAEKIDAVGLYEYYQKCLQTNAVDILVVGGIDTEEIKNLVEEYLDFGNEITTSVIDTEDRVINEVKTITKYDNIKQSHLILGYRTYNRINDELHFPMTIFNAMLGGYAHSLLFMNVREKASLSYSVFSRTNALKGGITIWAGIEKNKKDQALKIILEQIEIVKKGDFSIELLEMTKKAFVNDLLESLDSIGAISQKAYNDMLLNREFDYKSFIKKIENVSKDDVIKAANHIKLDTIFYLLGADENGKN